MSGFMGGRDLCGLRVAGYKLQTVTLTLVEWGILYKDFYCIVLYCVVLYRIVLFPSTMNSVQLRTTALMSDFKPCIVREQCTL